MAPGPGVAGAALAGASAGTAPIAVPAGNVGDIVLIDLYLEADRTVTPHTGFQSVGTRAATNRQWHYKYWWRADSTAAFTATFSFSSIYRRGFAVRYPGCIDTGTPYEGAVSGTNGGTSGTNTPSLSVTTTGPERLLVHSYTGFNTGTWTPSSGFTERVDSNEVGGSELAQATAGDSGPEVAVKSGSDTLTAWLLALIPAATGPQPQSGSAPIVMGASGEIVKRAEVSGSAIIDVEPASTTVKQAITNGTASFTMNAAGVQLIGVPLSGTATFLMSAAGAVTSGRPAEGVAAFRMGGYGGLGRAVPVSGAAALRMGAVGDVARFLRTLRFLVSAVNYDSVNTYLEFLTGKLIISLEDIGRKSQNTGADKRGTVVIPSEPPPPPPPPQKVRYDFDIQPYSSRSYEGDGSLLSSGQGDTYLYQGDIGVDGNRRSWMWFDPNTAGLGSNGSLNGMFGVPLADVELCELFLFYDHWYNSSGGVSYLGWHTGNSPGANVEPAGGFPQRILTNWPGRDVGMWINLKQNGEIMDRIRDGTLKGFMLGNTGNATRNHYGYAIGANGALGRKPGFRAVYYK